jgi:hypothetical protein
MGGFYTFPTGEADYSFLLRAGRDFVLKFRDINRFFINPRRRSF